MSNFPGIGHVAVTVTDIDRGRESPWHPIPPSKLVLEWLTNPISLITPASQASSTLRHLL